MKSKRSALIIASGDYTDPGLKQLRAPAGDARALAAVLRDPAIGDFEVRTLLNEPAHEVNLAVEEFFADRQPDDLLLVHISCHGVKDEYGELYFATADTRLRRLGATAVAAEFVNRRMSRSRSRRVLLLLDCTYVGAFEQGMTVGAGKGVGGEARRVGIEAQFGGRGRAVIAASSAMEYAFEGEQLAGTRELGPSVFTSALVEGLQTGDADRDQDGLVALDELYDYVYDKVRAATPDRTPGKWTFGMQGELVIARRAKPVTTPVPLPPELQAAIASPFATVRAAAVQELARVLHGNHAGRALAARPALEQLTKDDSRTVATAAAEILRSIQGLPPPPRMHVPHDDDVLPPLAPDLPASPIVDDDVGFTVYRPPVVSPGQWASLLVFVHKTTPVVVPGRGRVDPREQVVVRAQAHFGGTPPSPVGEDAAHAITRGTRLRIVLDLPGIVCNPAEAAVQWWEPVHEVAFRLLAGPELAGTAVHGAVRVWCGLLMLGQVSITIRVAATDMPSAPPPEVAGFTRRYNKIFPSYSHRDSAVVADFATVARTLGDQYLQDVLVLRPGERWHPRLLQLIEEADVFQLFWSRNSMRSPHCREEWEHALALQRPDFVLPVYWEEPRPEDPERGLPPEALQALHFVKWPGAGHVLVSPPAPSHGGAIHPVSEPEAAGITAAAPVTQTAGWDPAERYPAGRYPARRRRTLLVSAVFLGLLLVLAVILAVQIIGR